MSLSRLLSGKRILTAGVKALLRGTRLPDLLIRAKAELLKELKSDPALLAAARSQALAEIKTRGRLRDEMAALDDAMGFARLYDYTEEDLAANRRLMERFAQRPTYRPESLNWFVPHFDHALRGGIRTILSFGDYFRREKGVRSRVVIYGRRGADPAKYHQEIVKAFPEFPAEDVIVYDERRPDSLPESDGAIATLWTSAFHVLKFQRTAAKFYLVQDFEPLFYPAGTLYGLIEATYRFGFWGIANTPGVGEAYRAIAGAPTHSFVPAVDTSVYYPLRPDEPKHAPGDPQWVVFYGRPNNRRNCFELGICALKKLKEAMGDRVRLISVGSEWEPRDFGVEGVIENWGLLGSLEKVADLYRHCDAGLCFMQTKHPSYQPLEYMACGCPTVTNKNPANAWLLREGQNCLLAEPTASSVTDALVRVLTDDELRDRVVRNGLESVKGNTWDRQMDMVFDFMCKQAPSC